MPDTPFGTKDRGLLSSNLAEGLSPTSPTASSTLTRRASSIGTSNPRILILDGEGKLRILDFGLARLEGQESLTLERRPDGHASST